MATQEGPPVATEHTEVVHPDIKRIWVFPDVESAAQEAATEIVKVVQTKPNATITYATGMTMEPVYRKVSAFVNNGGVDFSQSRAFLLDEYYPCAPNAEFSFRRYFDERIVRPLGILPENAVAMNGLAEGPVEEARRYEGLLQTSEVDLAILGIGPGGHIGFNEPGTPFNQRTWVVRLSQETLTRNRQERGQTTPELAITQGIGNILEARQILLVAYGENKGEWLRQALFGPVSPTRPASALRLVGGKVTLIVDKLTGGKLGD